MVLVVAAEYLVVGRRTALRRATRSFNWRPFDRCITGGCGVKRAYSTSALKKRLPLELARPLLLPRVRILRAVLCSINGGGGRRRRRRRLFVRRYVCSIAHRPFPRDDITWCDPSAISAGVVCTPMAVLLYTALSLSPFAVQQHRTWYDSGACGHGKKLTLLLTLSPLRATLSRRLACKRFARHSLVAVMRSESRSPVTTVNDYRNDRVSRTP